MDTKTNPGDRPKPKHPLLDFQFIWGQHIGAEHGCDYLTRYVIVLFGFGLRLHIWRKSDDQRNYHDHPWWFVTWCVRGGYTDISPSNPADVMSAPVLDHLTVGALRFRPADWKHKALVDPGGAVTILLTGPKSRVFGFWPSGKFVRPLKYFHDKKWGHHQCD